MSGGVTPLYDTAQPYQACGMILRRGTMVAFVLRENVGWMAGYYGLPGGKVEKDEAASAGAIREAKEEAGVTVKLEDLRAVYTAHRHSEDIDWIDTYFEASRWEGEPFNAEPTAHSALEWLNITDLPENIIPSVRAALEAITRGEFYGEIGW